jgi:hypothetical protein
LLGTFACWTCVWSRHDYQNWFFIPLFGMIAKTDFIPASLLDYLWPGSCLRFMAWVLIVIWKTAGGQTFFKAGGQTFFLKFVTLGRRTRESVFGRRTYTYFLVSADVLCIIPPPGKST